MSHLPLMLLLSLSFTVPVVAKEPPFAEVRTLLGEYCNKCHSTEEQKGDLDLERFRSMKDVMKDAEVWEKVQEQMELGEMPPKDKPQLKAEERAKLSSWIQQTLETAARQHEGDPGPVVLRRLNNAEYANTLRDLTGVPSLDPVAEFPADSAAGEGFMNTGNALVMSPALLSKYLDAARDAARHAVLLPAGIGWARSISSRDWTEERLAAIRGFYARYTVNGGGTALNLQGIQFDTKDGGVLPLEKYLSASLSVREGKPTAEAAQTAGVNAKYLTLLTDALKGSAPSPLLDPLRALWKAGDVTAMKVFITQWQAALWRFTTVGHIGKRDGPKAWQEPVTPLAAAREVRLKLPPPQADTATFYLVTTDAGDGHRHDVAVWQNARLTAPGRADLPLRDVRAAVHTLDAGRARLTVGAEKCLAAAADVKTTAAAAGKAMSPADLEVIALRHGADPASLSAWLACLGIGGETHITSHMTVRLEKAESWDFIKGWTGADALSVLANSSDQHVRIPGNMKPHSVACHPAPKHRVIMGWQAPAAMTAAVAGFVQHAHPECGNGIAWALELRRGTTRQSLAAGFSQGANEVKFGPLENMALEPGDVLALIVSPRDGSHSCDLTAVDLTVTGGNKTWNLAKDISPNILAGNPHADSFGNNAVWHFFSEPDAGTSGPVLPAGSLLARWQSADADTRKVLAAALQKLLSDGPASLPKDSPDAALHALLVSFNGPLLSGLLRNLSSSGDSVVGGWGPDPALFSGTDFAVQAPAVIEIKLPAELAAGCEFVATAALRDAEGSVQMQAVSAKPASLGLAAGAAKEQGGKSTWSDGTRPVVSDSPILVSDNSAARQRILRGLDEFRSLFPAALCYTKIVPVDEVVTLTLYYREDEALRRLMLDEAQIAELERLWAELHYVSQDALKLVDAYEQIWQFATQDADPSAFTPMGEPIKQRAAAFRMLLTDSEPAHIEAALRFIDKVWRRPLTVQEQQALRELYAKLRREELPHDEAIRVTLARALTAPAFLYRMEKPATGSAQAPVSDHELATRLSYFLWASAPDDELRRLAAEGRLRDPDVLSAQARRMLQDDRVARLAQEFGCAWLHVYDFATLDEKSTEHFPEFPAVRAAMQEETVRVFTDFFRAGRPVLSLLDSDYTFVNEALAKWYGFEDVKGDWQRVEGIRARGRGGLLGQAAILAKQSGASRTSPILRGNWFCEVLLGEKLPRPPKGVPVLPETPPQGLTERQLIEKHSSDAKCAGCHVRIDPYGFALEAYDAVGRLRSKDAAGLPIDAKYTFPSGLSIEGLNGLREFVLDKRRPDFLRQFSRKLLGYALGRSVLLSDKPLLDMMVKQLETGTAVQAVEMIVRSRQFREIRGVE